MAIRFEPASKPGKTTIMKGRAQGKTDEVSKDVVASLKASLQNATTPPPAKRKASATSKPVEKNNKATKKPAATKGDGTKKLVSMRLDQDVLAAFRSMGKGWQGKINAALRQHLGL